MHTWCQSGFEFIELSEELSQNMTYTVSLQPPAAFRFDRPDEWTKWKQRFEQYRLASGLSEQSEERQTSTLLYTLGEDAADVLSSTNISNEGRKKYSTIMEKSDEFFSD